MSPSIDAAAPGLLSRRQALAVGVGVGAALLTPSTAAAASGAAALPYLRAVHASGRFDVPSGRLVGYWKEVQQNMGGFDLITTTESQPDPKRNSARPPIDVVRERFPDLRFGIKNEFIIGWNPAVLSPTTDGFLNTLYDHPNAEAWRTMYAYGRWFTHLPTGRPVRVMTSHCPAGVQDGDTWSQGEFEETQGETHRAGMATWGRLIERDHRPNGVTVAAMDLNLDLKRQVWRDYARGKLTGCAGVWRADNLPSGGTHGDRLIDAAYVRGAGTAYARISPVAPPEGVDHRAVTYRILMS